MDFQTLALGVASGILIAAAILFLARYAANCWRSGDGNMSVLVWGFVAVFGGCLILAGLGTIPF